MMGKKKQIRKSTNNHTSLIEPVLWYLSSQIRTETASLAEKALHPSHWTIREFPQQLFSYIDPLPQCVSIAVQFLSRVQFFATPWTVTRQAPVSFSISWSLFRYMSIESVILSGLLHHSPNIGHLNLLFFSVVSNNCSEHFCVDISFFFLSVSLT